MSAIQIQHLRLIWHRAAKWQWFAVLFLGAAGIMAIGEFGIGLFVLFLSGLSAASKIEHWKGIQSTTIKVVGISAVIGIFVLSTFTVIAVKGDSPWSRLPQGWNRMTRLFGPTAPLGPVTPPASRTQLATNATTEPDAHQQLVTGKLAQGWTLHKRGEVLSIYFILDTDQLDHVMIDAIDKTDSAIPADRLAEVNTLWSDIRLRVPLPQPARTEYGIVKGQEFVEHVTHYLGEPNAVTWTYEIMKDGSSITTSRSQVFKQVQTADLSLESRQTINELNALTVQTVNRRYIDAMVKISK